jgi:hypothetical protein
MKPALAKLGYAFVVIAAACGQPSEEGSGEEFFDPASVELGATFGCDGAALCSGAGTGTTPVYTSMYRVGTTATSRGELVQTFTIGAGAEGTPTSVKLPYRVLRTFTAPTTKPGLHVEIWPASACTPDCEGTAPVSGVAVMDAAFVAGGLATVPFTTTAQLAAGEYRMVISADAVPQDGSGTMLVGIGSTTSELFAGGAAERRGLRWSATLNDWAPSRFRPAGGSDIAFAIAMTPAVVEPQLLFSEDFESSSVGALPGSPWVDNRTVGGSSPDQIVVQSVSTKVLSLRNAPNGVWDGLFDGLYVPFAAGPLAKVTWRERNDGAPYGAVFIGDDSTGTNGGAIQIIHAYTWAGSQIYVNGATTCGTTAYQSVWTNVEVRNISIANQTFDLYVDGSAHCTNLPFANPTTEFTRMHVGVDWSANTSQYYDDFQIWR